MSGPGIVLFARGPQFSAFEVYAKRRSRHAHAPPAWSGCDASVEPMSTTVPKAPVANHNVDQVREPAPVQWRRSPLQLHEAWRAVVDVWNVSTALHLSAL